ncbi:class I SAM-dependent methyltransferase [Acetonema longum]|uniref:Methyltransferase type 11 n=1 Tax=Acetonema longum DSM 6540 TaxID=1009370 RepID=F7NQA0_9FIRM|nr:class I SAM-dependent methyltransferase [Acetonema longum]EGO61781.1 methyltransferase type 11 [Acetonema longum DSM 6540]
MQQNVYDNDVFYHSYIDLREKSTNFNDVLEIPAFRTLLPDLQQTEILDLGCGFGQSCSWYVSQGAARVVGVDISEKMIARAKQLYHQDKIEYQLRPIEDINFSADQFDLVLSSLAFHYIADFKSIVEKIYHCLKPKGFLIFSQEHPVATAKAVSNGWAKNEHGEKLHWMLDNYQDEGLRKQDWFIEGVIKYHRTTATIINTLIETGLHIVRVLEPTATAEAELRNEDLKQERRRPPFLIIKAQK